MGTTINMSSYEIEQDEMDVEYGPDVMDVEYGEEIMCAGWNPAVDLVCEQLLQVTADEQIDLATELAALNTPADVSAAVSDLFMRKMYSYQH